MRTTKILVSALVLPMAMALAGCQEKEGPAEKAGKELDNAAAAVGEKLESVGNQIQNSVTPNN